MDCMAPSVVPARIVRSSCRQRVTPAGPTLQCTYTALRCGNTNCTAITTMATPQPSLTNFGNLLNVRNMYEEQLASKGAFWHLVNSAVGPHVSLVKFPRSCGTTLCQVAETVRFFVMILAVYAILITGRRQQGLGT